MKKISIFAIIAAAAMSLASCKTQEQMLVDADRVTVKCKPSPLCVKGSKIEADIAINYPEGYFNPKAIMEVTAVIVYEGGEEKMKPLRLQGDKVRDNYRVVRSTGSTISHHLTFPYVKGMAVSHLELRSRCTYNKRKWVNLLTKKIADGTNITETLADTRGSYTLKDHGYQSVITLNPEGQVMYTINSSEVKNSELKSQSIKDFKAALGEMTLNERTEITGIEVVAYASPEGNEKFNNKLSTNRSKSANQAFDKVAKDEELTGVRTSVKSVGEDWSGFKEMVEKSDIEDKDLILRVLSMYNDPKVREREIRNLSSIYRDLADEVLPQLRRARFIANVEYTNYTDSELRKLIKENMDILDEPALLKAASLCKEARDKKILYKKAVEKYASKRAEFNLACVALDEGDDATARVQIAKCDETDPEVINLQGLVYLHEGDMRKAEECFIRSNTQDAHYNMGLMALLKGEYTDAVVKCAPTGTNAALSRLLAGFYDDAIAMTGDSEAPLDYYIRAIAYNRKGERSEAIVQLSRATRADKTLAARAKKDIEFINIR